MFEKVNPSHPDKVADRIAGAIVDLAYSQEKDPKIAVEVLLGHGECHIMVESWIMITRVEAEEIAKRIVGKEVKVFLTQVPQNERLAENQKNKVRCGDNGIFMGMPATPEQRELRHIVEDLYARYPTDGKYIIDDYKLIACQSNVDSNRFATELEDCYHKKVIVNPLGDWIGGIDVDAGATNRKLGSDMGDAITGGGLHGKDLSKADVSVNIYARLKAEKSGKPFKLYCAIGDEYIDGRPYFEIVEIARQYIQALGGFEKFAEWGLI